ncbi:MAG TPA: cytochrome c-type biogenesis protein CcmH [Acidimicrobiales bacterium]|nr:cytochrome c-type biogenesis protein CcmH [Acidimicrobiales bacterium]
MSAGLAATGGRGETTAAPPPAPGGVPARWWASRAAWLVLAAVAIMLLAVGSIHGSGTGAAARTAQLDAVIKCPACEDLSIAQSDAPSAVALRHRVARFVASGWSDARIESWVTARYGTNALLVPPAGGVNDTLYVVPVAAIGLAVAGLGWHLWQRRRALEAAGGWSEVPPAPDPGAPWHDADEDGTAPGR